MKSNRILKTPMDAPDDVKSVQLELARNDIGVDQVKAIMCMTEGDGLARGFASLAFSNLFHRELGWPIDEVPSRIPLVMIGGCSGLVSPYAALFVSDRRLAGRSDGPGLSIGIATTPDIPLEEFGTLAMVDSVAEAVRAAVREAELTVEDVHNVQIKAPWPATPQLAAAARAGRRVATLDGNRAGVLARSAGALGVAVALGEIQRGELTESDIGSNLALHSNIASASAGTERTNVAVIAMGNSPASSSPFRIGHAVLRDGIDLAGVYEALRSAGIRADRPLRLAKENPVEHVFVKSAVDLAAHCRGRRNVLQTDYLSPYSWLIGKAVIHATVAGIVGDPMMQVSGGGEHQGPLGGGLVAVVARK